MLRKKSSIKIRGLFIRYLSLFCIGTLALLTTIFVSFGLLVNSGVILPANYAEKQLTAVKERIAVSEVFTPDLIPDLCGYALFTTDGKVISGNFTAKEAEVAWNNTQNTEFYQASPKNYLKIQRINEVCIVSYIIKAEFRNQFLRELLPNVELIPFIIFGIAFFVGVFILATLFGKKLSLKMASLQNATEKIQNQDLNFIIEATGIYEIDKVLYSIEEMKEALKVSLKRQWDLEQTRREQISALAHDLKTPLTIIHGNTELLSETEQSKEQMGYTGYIANSVQQMEHYIKTLIQISKDDTNISLSKISIDSCQFMSELLNHINALINVKKIKLDFDTATLPKYFYADSEMLLRAVMNIVSNAVDYSPENSTIGFNAQSKDGYIYFTVTDSGKGFSNEAIKLATQQFYMGDHGRTSRNHYGMGLYITKTIIEAHGGSIDISNARNGGGQVILKIPSGKFSEDIMEAISNL